MEERESPKQYKLILTFDPLSSIKSMEEREY
jgi:hypothetical protein